MPFNVQILCNHAVSEGFILRGSRTSDVLKTRTFHLNNLIVIEKSNGNYIGSEHRLFSRKLLSCREAIKKQP